MLTSPGIIGFEDRNGVSYRFWELLEDLPTNLRVFMVPFLCVPREYAIKKMIICI